jgi:hypothetical protein
MRLTRRAGRSAPCALGRWWRLARMRSAARFRAGSIGPRRLGAGVAWESPPVSPAQSDANSGAPALAPDRLGAGPSGPRRTHRGPSGARRQSTPRTLPVGMQPTNASPPGQRRAADAPRSPALGRTAAEHASQVARGRAADQSRAPRGGVAGEPPAALARARGRRLGAGLAGPRQTHLAVPSPKARPYQPARYRSREVGLERSDDSPDPRRPAV